MEKRSNKLLLSIIGLSVLLIGVVGVTFAFFNYTRTGNRNVVRTGRITFNSVQGTSINLTNAFPIDVTNGIPNDNTVGSVTINVTGDTTYANGVEYLVSATNVHNTIGSGENAKTIPISIDVSVAGNATNNPATTLGTSDNNYFTNRGASANTSIYKILTSGTITEGENLLVGYIKSGETGVDGNIVIRAYLDVSKILISDTLENGPIEVEGYTNGTGVPEEKLVLTTSEWNSLQANGISFQVKVEANEGIWVVDPDAPPEEPWNATDASCFTYTEENNEIRITGYDEVTCGTDVVIPKKINNLNVTKIGDKAFTNGYDQSYELIGKGLTSVAIPDTVTSIEHEAFANNQLTSINLPSSVTTIGYGAFANNQLTSINLPSSVTTIEDGAFANNQLTSLTISSDYVGCNAFANNSITDLEILSGVTELYDSDGYFVFENNPITNVYIDMISIDYQFGYLSETLTTLTIGPHVQTIGDSAFADVNITSLTIPSSVTTIGDNAFSGGNITSLTIPSSVTTIGDNAFSGGNITSLTIPSSVTTIGYEAFRANNLTNLYVDLININDEMFNDIGIETLTIGPHVQTIGDNAFSNNQITSLTIPSSVTTIGDDAFSNNQITSLTIPSSVTTIGNYALYGNRLTSVTIQGKSSPSDFVSYGSYIWGWAYGYNDSNIVWEGSN